jgi:hypothetical protein
LLRRRRPQRKEDAKMEGKKKGIKTFSSVDIHVIPINFIGTKTWLEIYFYDARRMWNEDVRESRFEDDPKRLHEQHWSEGASWIFRTAETIKTKRKQGRRGEEWVAATPRNVFFIVRHKRLLCDARDRVESDGADRNLQNRNVPFIFCAPGKRGVYSFMPPQSRFPDLLTSIIFILIVSRNQCQLS